MYLPSENIFLFDIFQLLKIDLCKGTVSTKSLHQFHEDLRLNDYYLTRRSWIVIRREHDGAEHMGGGHDGGGH